ncbi:MAG: hypothetical protein EZS28_021686, partial [Streblomastix strix]
MMICFLSQPKTYIQRSLPVFETQNSKEVVVPSNSQSINTSFRQTFQFLPSVKAQSQSQTDSIHVNPKSQTEAVHTDHPIAKAKSKSKPEAVHVDSSIAKAKSKSKVVAVHIDYPLTQAKQIVKIKGDTESFQNLGKNLTQYFKQQRMILSCYVMVGCLAQVGGLSLNSDKSFQSLVESGFILHYHSPDTCHLNQNAFKHTIIQLKFLSIYVGIIKETTTFLRNSDIKKIIGARLTALEPQRGLISFYEPDFALAADVLILTYQAFLPPAGALSLSKVNLQLGLDLPSYPERDQIFQLLHYCQTQDMLYKKKLQFVERLAETYLSKYFENEEEDDEEEQKLQQDDSEEYKPYRNMAFEEQKDNRIMKMKSRSYVSDLMNVQNFTYVPEQVEQKIVLKALKDLQEID